MLYNIDRGILILYLEFWSLILIQIWKIGWQCCVCVCVCVISCWILIDYFETPWIVAHQAPLSTEFSRQEYYSGLTFLLQGIFPIQGLNPHCISCIDKWILCHWATWEAQAVLKYSLLFCHFGRGLSTSVTCIIVLTSLYL